MSNKDSFKKINIRSSNDKPLKIKADEIPNTVPEIVLNEWLENDDNPYYKIQAIKFPIKANGYNYKRSFFESYIKKLEIAPIPGSRDGHLYSWGQRANTDLLVVGAKIELNEKNNEKGTVYLKNYVPPIGASGDNAVFIKELKSNMIDFSLVSYTKDEKSENQDGSVTINVIESLFGERNDAVPREMGAMEQKLNSVEDGENNNREQKLMIKEEVLEALKTFKANGEITLPIIAKALGLESQLITDEQLALIAKLNSVQKLIGEGVDILEFVTDSIAFRKNNVKISRENIMLKEFGPEKYEDTKKENKVRTYAEKIFKGDQDITEEKINELKKDSVYITLAAERADVHSPANDLTGELEDVEPNKNNSVFDSKKVEV